MVKSFLIAACALFLIACGTEQSADYHLANLRVSGELLFEGPNTLQGPAGISIDAVASSVGVEPHKIKKIMLSEAAISFAPDSHSQVVESVLFQWVGSDLGLISLATKSPTNQQASIQLDVKEGQDILPYIKDATSTLVVDVNINQDLDVLEGSLALKLSVVY